jgi:hypothetical protein
MMLGVSLVTHRAFATTVPCRFPGISYQPGTRFLLPLLRSPPPSRSTPLSPTRLETPDFRTDYGHGYCHHAITLAFWTAVGKERRGTTSRPRSLLGIRVNNLSPDALRLRILKETRLTRNGSWRRGMPLLGLKIAHVFERDVGRSLFKVPCLRRNDLCISTHFTR